MSLPPIVLRSLVGGRHVVAGPPAFWVIGRPDGLDVLPGEDGDRQWLERWFAIEEPAGASPFDRFVHRARVFCAPIRSDTPFFGGGFFGACAWESRFGDDVLGAPRPRPTPWDFCFAFIDATRLRAGGVDHVVALDGPAGPAPAPPPWPFDPDAPPPFTQREPTVLHGPDRTAYGRAFRALRGHIAAGDTYQGNLCVTLAGEAPLSRAEGAFRHLCHHHPSAFGAYVRTPCGTFVSASPERFLGVEGRRVLTSPIKGTRARGRDDADDNQQRLALATSEKDAAELAMIVDLMRNDLSRCCVPGTVSRTVSVRQEQHRTLWHQVADVEGELREGRDVWDLLRCTFPPGSCVGAPKRSTLSILERLEEGPRGLYTGALGWVGVRGDCSFSVAIRTMTFDAGVVRFGVGGGVVWDSVEEDEWQELWWKARALRAALGDPTLEGALAAGERLSPV